MVPADPYLPVVHFFLFCVGLSIVFYHPYLSRGHHLVFIHSCSTFYLKWISFSFYLVYPRPLECALFFNKQRETVWLSFELLFRSASIQTLRQLNAGYCSTGFQMGVVRYCSTPLVFTSLCLFHYHLYMISIMNCTSLQLHPVTKCYTQPTYELIYGIVRLLLYTHTG